MRFTKMQGIGNDYVYVDTWDQQVSDPAVLAPKVSDRHFGIGSDGLVLIGPDEQADCRMRMFNIDGTEAQMCGNAVRCVAKYVYDHGRCRNNPLRVATGAGILEIELELGSDGFVQGAAVDMGVPILTAKEIPTTFDSDKVIDQPLEVFSRTWRVTCVSMGNPHAVVYVDDFCPSELETLGPLFETNPAFPERINVHFVHVQSPSAVTMWTWERGCGVTLACGTGASAVCVAGVLTGRTERKILAHLPGGDLELNWRESDDHLIMIGPATEVFSGDWPE